MSGATTSRIMSPELAKVAERAKRNPSERILALARFIDAPGLARAFDGLRKNAALGVDGVTVKQYGEELAANLRSLHDRMKAGKYRHQPIRRVHIPKDGGKTRPIGISTTEDKIVQAALRDVLEAVYEQDFLDCSHGFRPGRRAHDAVRGLNREVTAGTASYILDDAQILAHGSDDLAGILALGSAPVGAGDLDPTTLVESPDPHLGSAHKQRAQ